MADEDAQRRAQREARILGAANTLITHYGYDKTTMDDIAGEAGVSKGAIYLHFKSKEALFEALILRESERVMEDMFERIEADPEGGTLFQLYTHALVAAISNPLIRALFTRDRRVLGDFQRRMVSTETMQQGMIFGRDFILHLQDAGLVRRDLSAETITYLLAYMRMGFFMSENVLPPEHTPSLDVMMPAMATMLSTGLAPGEGHDSEAGKAIVRGYVEQMRAVLKAYRAQAAERQK
ncbi:MAG: TetR/AcrR family transcriptional regulator [Anaerolinea sp.]|nr:TetR/AcrR family transcriptional regulator [Anaerolinea sp.]